MQRCPKCYRSYASDNQKYCTTCGGRLVPDEEKATASKLNDALATYVAPSSDTIPNAPKPVAQTTNFDPLQTVNNAPTPPLAAPTTTFDPLQTIVNAAEPPSPVTVPPAAPTATFDPLQTIVNVPEPSPATAPPPPVPATTFDPLQTIVSAPLSSHDPELTMLMTPAPVIRRETGGPVVPPPHPVTNEASSARTVALDGSFPPLQPPPVALPSAPVVSPPPVPPVEKFVPPATPKPVPVTPKPAPVPPLPVSRPLPGPAAPAIAPAVAVALPGTPAKTAASRLPLILGILGALLVLLLVALGAAYVLVIKPRLAARSSTVTTITPDAPPRPVANSNATANAPTLGRANVSTVVVAPPDSARFVNEASQASGKLAEHFVDFSFYYPKAWTARPTKGTNNFADFSRNLPGGVPQEVFTASWYDPQGSDGFAAVVAKKSAELEKFLPATNYQKVSEGPTRVGGAEAYEFRFQGEFTGAVPYWGRVIFLPSGVAEKKNGVTLFLLATAKAPEVKGVADVGEKGELPVILNTFRLGTPQ